MTMTCDSDYDHLTYGVEAVIVIVSGHSQKKNKP
jgi:hypothetical protein